MCSLVFLFLSSSLRPPPPPPPFLAPFATPVISPFPSFICNPPPIATAYTPSRSHSLSHLRPFSLLLLAVVTLAAVPNPYVVPQRPAVRLPWRVPSPPSSTHPPPSFFITILSPLSPHHLSAFLASVVTRLPHCPASHVPRSLFSPPPSSPHPHPPLSCSHMLEDSLAGPLRRL
ncbi:hypothetical protein C8J57DRAFT_1530755 [Mycena rebaudengoi]|nr:hypothetical protein C8J57DRAFT_1530755 [Mycena rebaudengoi]